MSNNGNLIHSYLVCLQLALSDTNKLYVWGASPQVLRLQAQAQKKTRILEQQEEKKNRSLEESERVPSGVINLNEEMKELLEDNVQSMETETIASVETRKKPSENADLKNITMKNSSIDESQAHLKPSVVDTSLIKGQITQVC